MMSTVAPLAITVDEYARFRSDGFLIVRGVLAPAEVQELLDHSASLPEVASAAHPHAPPAAGDP